MLKYQFKYMSRVNRSLLCHDLYHNGFLSIICLIFKESENSDTFQFWHFPILTLSNSDTLQFWHFPIMTLSNYDTFQFWHFPIMTLSDSDTFQLWHFQILTLSSLSIFWSKKLASKRHHFQLAKHGVFPTELGRACRHVILGPAWICLMPMEWPAHCFFLCQC